MTDSKQNNSIGERFWEKKTLETFTSQEMEALCDHCGLCCLVRIEDENNGDIYDTNVICTHYDSEKRGCSRYQVRTQLADGCVQLTPELLKLFDWLPDTCAYVRHSKGLPLLPNHHLLHQNDATKRDEAVDADVQIINVVDKYESMGLIKNSPEVIPEQHLVFSDEFDSLEPENSLELEGLVQSKKLESE